MCKYIYAHIYVLVEAEIENIVFSDQKYDGDSLNIFTHENSFFSSGGKKEVMHLSFKSILEERTV